MKKVLSVLCMALLAGGMIFTSCTQKQYTITVNSNNDAWGTVTGGGTYNDGATATLTATPKDGYIFVKWQDGTTENPRTITVTADETWTAYFEAVPVSQGTTKVTFNGSTWNAANMTAYDKTAEGYLYAEFFKVANSEDNIYCDGFLETTPGSYDFQTNKDIVNYRDPNFTYYDAEGILDNENHQPGEYWGWNTNTSSFTETVTAVDLNALTISGSWNAEVFSAEEYVAYLQTGAMPAMHPFSGVIDNMPWTWKTDDAKGNATKKATKQVAQRVK